MDTATMTGADKLAGDLAAKLKTAGWETSTAVKDRPGTSGRMPGYRSVFLYADGAESTGFTHLLVHWVTAATEPASAAGVTTFDAAEITVGAVHRVLHTETELTAWLDAINAVAAATRS